MSSSSKRSAVRIMDERCRESRFKRPVLSKLSLLIPLQVPNYLCHLDLVCVTISKKLIFVDLVSFYGISTLVGYSKPNRFFFT